MGDGSCPNLQEKRANCFKEGRKIEVPPSELEGKTADQIQNAHQFIFCCSVVQVVNCMVTACHGNGTEISFAEEEQLLRNHTTNTTSQVHDEPLSCTDYDPGSPGARYSECLELIRKLENPPKKLPSSWLIVGCILAWVFVAGLAEVLYFKYKVLPGMIEYYNKNVAADKKADSEPIPVRGKNARKPRMSSEPDIPPSVHCL